ncbi:MAG: hypothetical protein ACI3Y0_04730 [Prevotella sp.]
MNRIFYLLLSIIMAANVNVARAWEYPTSDPGELPGSGTEEDPYRISSAQDFANLTYRVNNGYNNYYFGKYIVLTNDIVFNENLLSADGTPSPNAKVMKPIGVKGFPQRWFRGNINGNGHTISGVYIRSDADNVGLIGWANSFSLLNLKVVDSFVGGSGTNMGGLLGCCNAGGKIVNCSYQGVVSCNNNTCAGGIVGAFYDHRIESCHFEGVVKCEEGKEGATYMGGIAGWTDLKVTIKNCTVNGSVIDTGTSTCQYIGGIVGWAELNLENCTMLKGSGSGNVVSSNIATYIGGVAGGVKGGNVSSDNMAIKHCYNYATVKGYASKCYIGGVAGYAYNAYCCGNFGTLDLTGTVSSGSYSELCGGGVVGWNKGIDGCFNAGQLLSNKASWDNVYLAGVSGYTDGTMKNCFNTGTVETYGNAANYALAEYAYYGVSDNNNYYLDGSATYSSPTNETVGKSSRDFFQSYFDYGFIAKMESESTWGGGTWGLDPVTKLPIPIECGGKDAYFVMHDTGAGTATDPYRISDYNTLMRFHNRLAQGMDYKDVYFKQTCDFDFAENTFQPLGTDSEGNWKAFRGHYDGDDHTVKNISYTSNTWFPTGFFAELGEGAEVKNLKFTDNSLTVSAAGKVGMVAGKATKASLSGIYVRDCKINQTLGPVIETIGSLIGYDYGAGALAGTFTGDISRCSVYYTDITGNQIGGLAGIMQEQTTVEDAVVQASLHASQYNVGESSYYPQCAGGITSHASAVKVARCVVLPTVDYTTYDSWGCIGGLFGVSYSGNFAEYTMCNMNEPENSASRWGHLMGINNGGVTSLNATNVQIYDKTKYKNSYGEELSNTDGIKDFVSDLHGWSPIYLNSGASNLGNMHFSYYHALPQQGIGSYAVTSANGECSAYTDMSDYGEDFWTRPDNLYIDLSYPEVSSDNNVLTAVGDIDPLIVERKSNVVNSEGQASKIYLYDGKPVAYHSAITAKTLSYSRNFTNTSWQPLYVPFAMTYDQWTSAELEVATLNGMNIDQDENGKLLMQLSISKVTEGRIEANTPCLIRSNEVGEKKMELTDVTMAVTNMSSHVFGNDNITVTINPTYFELDSFNGYEDESTNDYIMKDGKFGRAAVNAILKPQRWYFTLSKDNAEASDLTCFIPFEFNGEGGGGGFGGSATKIEDIQVVTAPTSTDRLYDLQGRRLTTAPQKGVYIMNNKKVVK